MDSGEVVFSQREKQLIGRLSPLGAPPVDETNEVVEDERAAHLGQFLFFDERLSANGKVSCATCHRPDHAFTMPAKFGLGIESTPRHVPTVINSAYYHWFNWDGSADSLWAQAIGPLENPREMGFTRVQLARLVASDPDLRAAYEQTFGELPDMSDTERFPEAARPVPTEPEHPHHQAWEQMSVEDRRAVDRVLVDVSKAMAAYQTKLVRNDAPFDTFVEGLQSGDEQKLAALSEESKRGLDLFVGEAGCTRCHTGANFTDGSFHNLGLSPRDWMEPGDEGRWDGVPKLQKSRFNAAGEFSADAEGKRAKWLAFLTRTPEDHGQFKTPTLRNVALTAPYMHGGHFETLEEVVRFYARLDERAELGHREEVLEPLDLSDADVAALVAFLESLTGEPLPDQLTRQPDSPLAGTTE